MQCRKQVRMAAELMAGFEAKVEADSVEDCGKEEHGWEASLKIQILNFDFLIINLRDL